MTDRRLIKQLDLYERAYLVLTIWSEDYCNVDPDHQKVIDDLRRDLATRGLRFPAPVESARCGGGSGSPQSGETQTARADATTIVDLPRKISDDLRQLTFDADQLRVEYQRCYDWANSPVNQ